VNRADRLSLWEREERHPFTGWDFAHLDGRMIAGEPPWSYPDRAAALMRGATALLDVDTGGGERLLELREAWPRRVTATESYPPNVRVATERLGPLGATVVAARSTSSSTGTPASMSRRPSASWRPGARSSPGRCTASGRTT